MVWDKGQDDFWVYVEKECRRVEEGALVKMSLIELGPVGMREEGLNGLLLMEFPLHGSVVSVN